MNFITETDNIVRRIVSIIVVIIVEVFVITPLMDVVNDLLVSAIMVSTVGCTFLYGLISILELV